MAKGILIDVGFTSDVKGYIEQLEKDFQKIDFSKAIGISDAFDKQISDVKDKIADLKKEIETIGKGHGIDVNFKNQFEDMNKSIRVLQESMKALMQTAPKSKQAGLTNQLEQINSQIKDVANATKQTTDSINALNNAQFVDKRQIENVKKLYHNIERARQATEDLQKTRNKVGNTPYENTDEVMNDIKAQMKLYSELAVEQEKLFNSKKKDKDTALTENTTKLATSITNTIQLINSLKAVAGSNPLNGFQFNKTTNIEELNTRLRTELDKVLQTVADQKVKLQSEFADLGGEGLLSDMFKKATRKLGDSIIFPVMIDPKSKPKLLKECIELINTISEQLESSPIKVEVQLVSAYQSKKNAALIQELQKQITQIEQETQNRIANGLSEAEATQYTEATKNLQALITRMNKQIDNAMIFTVEVNTKNAINSVNAFIEEVREKLPNIKPGIELSKAAQKSFKAQVNNFIKDLNKEIVKIQAEKGKINNDVFSSYVKQLSDMMNTLKEFAAVLSKDDFINLEEKTKQLQAFKETFDRNIAGIQLELINAFDPEKNNLGLWSNTLLSTLRTALIQIQKISEYKLFQIDNSQTQQATTEMVEGAKDSTADAQQSHSPSKVAEQLGKYWGDGYAQGILNSTSKVQNAVRALVEAGKLTALDLANDTSTEADYVSGKIANGTNPTTQAKRYQKIIAEFDTYQRVVQDSLKLKLPMDETVRNNVLEVQKKNLEDIRQGAIDAQKAIYNLREAFGGNFIKAKEKELQQVVEQVAIQKKHSNKFWQEHISLQAPGWQKGQKHDRWGDQLRQFLNNQILWYFKNLEENLGTDHPIPLNQMPDKYILNLANQFGFTYGKKGNGLGYDIRPIDSNNIKSYEEIYKALGQMHSAKELAKSIGAYNEFIQYEKNSWESAYQTNIKNNSEMANLVVQDAIKYLHELGFELQNGKFVPIINISKEGKQNLENKSASSQQIKKVNEQIAKSEEKPITKTQQLIEQFKTLHQLMQDAFGNKDLSLMQKYFTDMQNVNAQMGKSHIKGAKDRGSLIQGYQDAISNIENEKKQTETIKQKTETIKISKKEQEALTQAEHEFVDSISSAENNVLGTNIQTLQQKAEVIKVSKEEQKAYTAAEHEFIDSIAKSENNVLHTNAQAIEQKAKQTRISKQQQEELTKGEHELVDSLREEQNAILGINQQTEQEIKVQEQLKNAKGKQKSVSDVKQVDVTKALNKEVQTVVPGLKEETAELNKLKKTLKDIPQLIHDKTNAFVDEKKAVKNAVTSEISDLGKLSKAQAEEKKKKEQDVNLHKAQKNLDKNYQQIQSGFTSMLQKDNRTLVESSIEPTKDGLIKIKALIKEADDSYKSFIYTTKTGKGKNPFTLVEAKGGFTVDKQAALFEKWQKVQEELKKEPQMIGNIQPNTAAWKQLVSLAEDFGLEMKDIVQIIRNVDHGVESFQFFDKAGNRTTLGINSDYKLYEKNPILTISKDLDDFKKKMSDLPKIIRNGITNYDANAGRQYIDTLNQIAELWKRIREYQKMSNISGEEFTSLQKLFGGSSQTIIDTLSAKLPTDKKTPEMIQQIDTLKNEFQLLFQSINDGGFNIDGLDSKIVELITRAKELYQNIGADENRLANPTAISKLLANIGDELTRNTKMSGTFRVQLESLVKEIQDMGQAIPNDKFKDFAARFQNIRSQIHLAGQTGKGFFDQMSTSLGRSIIQFANMYLSLYRVVGYIRQGVNEVTKLDKALTTMSYTMNITNSQIKEMGNNIVAMAKDLKISVDNVSQIYQIYANMQTTTEEMMKTARPTAILTNLSGVDASTAADQIQGVLNQFNMLADESMHIVDVYDYISANIPVDYSKGIAGMADAVKNVGNVAAEAGLSFEQLGAIIGKVMAKTRQDGSSIGNALRTIMVRISKANKLAGDEVDNATVGNAAKALHNIGVEVYTTSGEFREFDVIMSELAKKWDDLSDAEQANISFQIAATRQMFASVYSNMHKRIYLIAGNA